MTTLATLLALSDQSFDRLLQVVGAVVLAYLAYKTKTIGAQMNEVQHNTNSLTERLVEKTATEAEARGGQAERDRAAERGDVRGRGAEGGPTARSP